MLHQRGRSGGTVGAPGCGEVLKEPQGVGCRSSAPPPQSRARLVFGVRRQPTPGTALLRRSATRSAAPACPPRTAVALPYASEAPRGLRHSKRQALKKWRRKAAGPVGADLRRQHLEPCLQARHQRIAQLPSLTLANSVGSAIGVDPHVGVRCGNTAGHKAASPASLET